MSLSLGTRVGPYEVTAPLGQGGMGAVYRARDTKLNRDVALKVLLPEVTDDPERLARFRREAQTLAALNHPHVGAIYGLEEVTRSSGSTSATTVALVLELVEGPTLAERIARGPTPVDDALPIAKQIAEALDAAHAQGIVHRDLKPANIKVREDGTVKVLDFGLAKALDPARGAPVEAMDSPTITSPAMTQAGVVLGTAAYMAPEQARGRPVDRRADIWAFGVVVFEMLAGDRAFQGEDVADTLALVVRGEPAWDKLPTTVPARIRQVLRACLQKDPRQRLGDMQSVRLALEGAFEIGTPLAPTAAPAPRATSRAGWIAGAVGVTAAVLIARLGFISPDVARPPRVTFELPADVRGGGQAVNSLALSPDGGQLVASVSTAGGPGRLWVRSLDRLGGSFVAETEGAVLPCWSLDGRMLAFGVPRDPGLFVVDVAGGAPQRLADAPTMRGCSWNGQRTILYSANRRVLRIDASGGSPATVTEFDAARGDTWHMYPVFLPDGVHFLLYVDTASPERSGIYVGSLESTALKWIGPSSIGPRFAAPDLLFFGRDSALMAQRFDTTRLELVGTPIRVTGDLAIYPEQFAAGVSVAAGGAIVYRPGSAGSRILQWRDRAGTPTGSIGEPGAYRNPRLSPDETRLAVAREDGDRDIWVTELASGTFTRLTFDPASDDAPVWSPDGSRIAFSSSRASGIYDLYVRNANGTGTDELLLRTPNNKTVSDWSADGRYLVYEEQGPTTKADIWALPLFGDRKPFRLVGTPAVERTAALSPDGRWLAYVSEEGGRDQVFVQGFPEPSGRWQVSTTRGALPLWRSAGEILYDAGGTMMSVDVAPATSGGGFKIGVPRPVLTGLMAIFPHNMDATRSGERLLTLARAPDPDGADPIVVILNWRPEFQQ